MKLSHRILMVLAPALLILPSLAAADDKAKEKAAPSWGLTTDAHAGVQLQAAAAYIRDEDWPIALRLLQHQLDAHPDTFARLPNRVDKSERLVSVHAEAERLLASLPQAGRQAYQHTYGPRAAAMWEEVRQAHDSERLSRLVERYLYTEAGPAALAELARRYTREGRLVLAAMTYTRLLEHVGPARWTNEDLYHAAAAFHHFGFSSPSRQVLKQLLARSGQKVVRFGERKLTAEELQKEIERAAPSPRALEWPLYRGDAARGNRGIGGLPLLEARWRRSMLYERNDSANSARAAQEQIRRAEKKLQERQEPIIPAFSPLAVTAQDHKDKKMKPLLLCKNYFGVLALDARDGRLSWLSSSNGSLQHLLDSKNSGSRQQAIAQWLNAYHNQYPQILFENSTVGTLSSDGELVYVIEDLAVPPMPIQNRNHMGFFGGMPNQIAFDKELEDPVAHNRLYALSLAANGKLYWELPEDKDSKGPLADCYFLGPPLPLDGLLYVLIQKNKQVSLLCFDPKHEDKTTRIPQPKIIFIKPLVDNATSVLEEPLRRTRAAHLAYADGILVCPTHAGVVLGVEVLTNRVAWVYPYPHESAFVPNPRAVVQSKLDLWKTTAPVIADGKVVLAPPDDRSLYCLNLFDGSLRWSHKKDRDDVYLAGVHDGKVLIVGKNSVQALSLATGASLWTRETGLPSGQGVAAGDRYYLPLQRGAQSKQPEILVLDIAKGHVIAHIKARSGRSGGTDFEVPGNLVFAGGKLISQSPWQIVAYPPLQDKADKVNERLKQNPGDPASLIERAELRRDKGELTDAIEDLRAALRNKLSDETRQRARDLLFETVTELLQLDLRAGEADVKGNKKPADVYLEELGTYKMVWQPRKHIRYYKLVAHLRESQGRLTEALQAYLELSRVLPSEEMLTLPSDPAVQVRLDLWIRGRIAELLKKATPDHRKEMEAEMERRLKEARGRNDDQSSRSFLEIAGPETSAGREARLSLAERLLSRNTPADLREAEQHLLVVRQHVSDSARAARAVEMLGRLMTARGLLPDAVYFYRILRRDFGKTLLSSGKSGVDVWDALAADKRFLPYLNEPAPFTARRFSARKEIGDYPMGQAILSLQHAGEELPYFRLHRLGLEIDHNKIHLRNLQNGENVWTAKLTPPSFRALLPPAGVESWPRFRYHTRGHVVVVPVDNLVYGLDVVGRCILWQKDLLVKSEHTRAIDIDFDPLDGSPRLVHPDGWVQFPEQNIVLGPSVVCLASQTGLQGCDPLTGQVVWTRGDLPRSVRLFGEGEHVFMVEENAKGEAVSTRVLRLADGGSVAAADFTTAFAQRVQIHGRTLVLSQKDDKGAVMLRLYDVPSGAAAWERTFAAKSLVMRGEAPGFAGVVEPNGKVHVLEVATRKEVLTGQMKDPAAHLRKVRRIQLLADDNNFYLACSAPADGPEGKEIEEETAPGYDLRRRAVAVNGMLYAFARGGGGEPLWYILVKHQRLVLEQLRDLPLLFLMSYARTSRPQGVGPQRDLVLTALCIQKNDGRVVLDETLKDGKPFYAVRADRQRGTIEYLSPQVKIVCRPLARK